MISERSANRGSCAQSCRKDYVLADTATGAELDRGFLISAKDLAAHDHLAELAAAYAFGIARNHPFVDGNKRTALLALYTFLGVNEVDFIVPEADAAAIILSLAAGEVSEPSLARWIRDNWPPGKSTE